MRWRRMAVAWMVLMCAAVWTCAAHAQQASRKIVVFDESFVNTPAKEALLQQFGGVIVKHLHLLNGASVYLPPQAERALGRLSQVVRIDEDIVVTASGKPAKPPSPSPAEVLPWGVDRIEADLAWTTATGAGVRVGILDTGIDLDHPDLAANVKGGINCISPRKNADDDNGHGTHVAGIVAAVHNTIGVVGVAPEVSLYAVKVLAKNGTGFLSDIIEGLDWCVANGIRVANMSFGSSVGNQSFHDAISRAYNAGVVLVAAAGNESGPVSYPAKYPEVIAVSAVGRNADGSLSFASFSNFGPEIDLAAPGVSVFSTYRNGTYATMSGTSMAAPHVTGVAALVLSAKGAMSPAALEGWLKSTAEDLSLPPEQQGAGLIRADAAVQ
mgnify:CR=1 FL=1